MPIPDTSRIKYPRATADQKFELLGQFILLEQFVDRFRFNLELFDHATTLFRRALESHPTVSGAFPPDMDRFWEDFARSKEDKNRFGVWRTTAARDAMFSIFEFVMAVDTINTMIAKIDGALTPEVRANLKRAHRLVEEYFPNAENIRNSAGHVAELARPDEREKHAFTGTHNRNGLVIERAKNIAIADAILEREYTTTFKGKILACEVSADTLAKLQKLKMTFFTIFGPLDPDPVEQARAATQPLGPRPA